MSTDSTRIHCTGCDYEYSEHYQTITLKCKIESGIVSYYHTNCWCYDCNKITKAEHLPDIDGIRKEYAEWCGVPGPAVSGLKKLIKRFGRHYREDLQELQNKIAWRQARTAPPHCLDCGSTNLVILNFVNNSNGTAIAEDFKHSCGGILVHDFNDKTGIRFHFAPKEIWMDIEGNTVAVPGSQI